MREQSHSQITGAVSDRSIASQLHLSFVSVVCICHLHLLHLLQFPARDYIEQLLHGVQGILKSCCLQVSFEDSWVNAGQSLQECLL